MNEIEARKMVEASEERANTILRTAMDGFWLVDVQGQLLDVNDTYCRMSGYSREELLRMSIAELDVNESSDQIAANIEKVMQDGSARFERQHRRKDGRIIEVELSVTYLPNSEGRFFCFLRDITEHKHNEAVMASRLRLLKYAMSHSLSELLRATLDEAEALTGSNVGFYHCLEPDQVTLSLQAWSTNTTQHMCKAEGAGLHYPVNRAGVWVDCIRERKPVIHNDYASLPHRKGLPEGHSPVIRELVVPVMRGDSIVAVLGVGNKPEHYDDGDSKTVATLADLAWDITERKRAEEAQKQSERLNKTLLDNIPDPAWIKAIDGRFLEVNKAWCRVAGLLREKAVGRADAEIFPPEIAAQFQEQDRFVIESGQPQYWEELVQDSRGIGLLFETFKTPLTDSTGTITGTIGIARDITQRKRSEQALHESEEQFRSICNTAQDAIIMIDERGNISFWSESAVKMFGYAEPEVKGRNLHELIVPHRYHEAHQKAWPEFRATGHGRAIGKTIELTASHKNGTELCVELSLASVQQHGLWCGVGIVRDITERKRTEEALLQERQFLRQVIDAAPSFVCVKDREGRFLMANQALATFYGTTVACVEGHLESELNSNALQVSQFQRDDREAMDTCQIQFIPDESVTYANGQIHWLATQKVPLIDERGRCSKVLNVTTDITERKRAEAQIKKLTSAVEQSPASIVITDLTGAIEYTNPKFTLVSGYTLSEVRGQNPRLLKSDNVSADEYRQLWECITHGREWRGEFHNRKKNGDFYWESASISPIIDADGRITHFLAVKEDITDRKVLEEQFRQAQKLDSIGQLAGGVAHDFNNILAAIMMRLDFLQQNQSFDEETQESLAELTVAAKRAARLTRQLLIFSRKSILDVKVLDLNEVVANLLNMLDRLIGEHITVRFDRRAALPAVEADAGMLEQVVMNLAVNARDAMPQGGKLTISIEPVQIDEEHVKGNFKRRLGRFVCLSVADTGCGMDEATLQRVFEPFFTTKEVGKGTGLGLATVDGIVAQHKGWVDVESDLGKGTTFKVFLPALAQGRTEQATIEKTPVIRGHETILLVEDEAGLRRLVAQGLRQMGYRVLEADNGQTAMKLWQEQGQQIDLLFSDMVMPEGMTGLDLAEKFKQAKSNLKIIISSGYNVEMAGHAKPTAGGIVYFQKPYEFEVLSKTVRDCLDRVQG